MFVCASVFVCACVFVRVGVKRPLSLFLSPLSKPLLSRALAERRAPAKSGPDWLLQMLFLKYSELDPYPGVFGDKQ